MLSKKGSSMSNLHRQVEDGEPLARVPHGKTVPRTVLPPLLSF